jgi:dTDP-4-dehydrorhamnose 3,5-epimerase-like enzyme
MNLEQLEVKKDARGSLVEAYKLPNDGQIFYVIANPNETRGNHYHKRKTEHFLVMYGSATIMVRDRKSDDVMKVEVSGYKPMVVTVTPNHTHSITASNEGAIFLVWCDEIYKEDDADTIGEEV